VRAALFWLAALSLSTAGCGITKPVGLPDASDAAPDDADTADGHGGGADVVESECVTAAVQLPWAAHDTASGTAVVLDVVAGTDAIAVLHRQDTGLDVRTYGLDGTFKASGSFSGDTQVLAAPGGGFAAIARTDDGKDLVEVTFDATLKMGMPDLAVSAAATERSLAAVSVGTTPILVTDERFINLATGQSASWAAALGLPEADLFKGGRIYGMSAQGGKILLAWGAESTLGLVVLDTSGHVLAHVLDDEYLGYLGAETTSAMSVPEGVLLFDGNPVRTTKIDFALARDELARNLQLRTFYRTVAKVAGVMLNGRPVGFWLTVFPASDNSQGNTPHQLYGCALDLAAAQSCAGTSLVASTELGGYGIAGEPLAATALPGGAAVAVVHDDAAERTWLRIADLRCERPRD
jgi:predicted small lipoprotein YifL